MSWQQELKQSIDASVARRVRELRLSQTVGLRTMTQEMFAAKTLVPQSTIANIENGRQGATLAVIYQIAFALNLDLTDILPTLGEVAYSAPNSASSAPVSVALPEWAEVLDAGASDPNEPPF